MFNVPSKSHVRMVVGRHKASESVTGLWEMCGITDYAVVPTTPKAWIGMRQWTYPRRSQHHRWSPNHSKPCWSTVVVHQGPHLSWLEYVVDETPVHAVHPIVLWDGSIS